MTRLIRRVIQDACWTTRLAQRVWIKGLLRIGRALVKARVARVLFRSRRNFQPALHRWPVHEPIHIGRYIFQRVPTHQIGGLIEIPHGSDPGGKGNISDCIVAHDPVAAVKPASTTFKSRVTSST